MKRQMGLIALFLLFLIAAVHAADDGRINRYSDGLQIGSGGTKINHLSLAAVVYAGTQSSTCSLSGALPGDDYWLALDDSALTVSPGTITYSVTTDTLAVSTANPTSGTLKIIVIGK